MNDALDTVEHRQPHLTKAHNIVIIRQTNVISHENIAMLANPQSCRTSVSWGAAALNEDNRLEDKNSSPNILTLAVH